MSLDGPGQRRLTLQQATLALIAAIMLGALGWVLAHPEAPLRGAQAFSFAEVCREAAADQPYRRAALAARLRAPPSDASCNWETLVLPLRQHATSGSYAVDRRLIAVQWLRIHLVVPALGPDDALGFYMPRLSGDGWRLWMDGRIVSDNLDDWRMTWNRALWVEVPRETATPGSTVTVVLGLAYGESSGVSMTTLEAGPASSLRPAVMWREALQTALPQACSAIQLLFGIFFFALWLARRSETGHLLLALSSIAWSVCNLQYTLPRHDDPRIDRLYDGIVSLSVAWVMWLVYLAAPQFGARQVPWLERWLPRYVLLASVGAMLAYGLQRDISVLLQSMNSAVSCIVTTAMLWLAWRGNAKVRPIAIALLAALLAGIHDVALVAHMASPTGIYLLPYSSLLVTAALLLAVQRRYAHAIAAHEELSASLNVRLAQREQELNASHEKLRSLEQVRVRSEERERLIGDIHDGLGSTLVTTLAALQSRRMSAVDAAEAVQACIDDMRLVIDSLDPVARDVGMLLASVRWRITPRIESAGLVTHWQLPVLAPLPWLDAPLALDLLRLLQEAFANTIKHGQARQLDIAAEDLPQGIVLSISDDGRGFDPDSVRRGRGLRFMTLRAGRLGGHLRLLTRPGGGTRWELHVPRNGPTVVV